MTKPTGRPVGRPPTGRVRYCANCGENMGFILNADYDRDDTCGSLDCERVARGFLKANGIIDREFDR